MLSIEQQLTELGAKLASARNVIPVFKEALALCREQMAQQFYAGTDAEELVHDRARFIDGLLTLAWKRFDWDENLSSWRKTRISLVAVGGYGRGELHPHSDIDLLVLLERASYQKHAGNIQSFMTLLWDIGLEVGHSVRSIKECKSQAANDVTIITALIEARTITGDDALRVRMQEKIGPGKIWKPAAYYKAKRNEQEERHQKWEYTEYSLEPNIKSSPGTLRDIQTVMWIAKRQFGAVTFDDLVQLQFLTQAESDVLRRGRKLFWKIRFGLHEITDRDEDRLLFEYQRQLAESFGYVDQDQLAVEQFMQEYYRTAMEVRAANDLLLQHFREDIIGGRERTRVIAVNERFQISNNYIEVTHDRVFEETPSALLELFVIMGNRAEIEGVRASTIRLISANLHRIDDRFRADPEVTRLFMDLLRSTEHLFSQLRRMERYGILGAYLPEFGRVIGQMQFDLFHVYTVDAHTLQVVRNMRRFRYRNQEQKFPIAAHIHRRLPKVELLYIAGLYHDIAKGMGGDHSELGVDIARNFCARHDLGTWDTNLVCWLVKNHLVMSATAQRKDIFDPEVVHEFAIFVGDQVRLDYLYALTVADINATNSTLWNSWRASLMSQLYLDTKRMLRQGLEKVVDKSEYIAEVRNHAIERLSEHGLTSEEILQLWDSVDEDYFVRESVSDIVWHTLAIRKHGESEEPLILIQNDFSERYNTGATHIFIHALQEEALFAASVTAFDNLDLNIVDARIASSGSGVTFDTFVVLDSKGNPIGDDPAKLERIRKALLEQIAHKGKFKARTNRRTPRLLKQFDVKTEVSISNDLINDLTMLEVTTPDRPGLLSVVANIFIELGIVLQSAKITTLGERVEDVFYIVDQNHQAIRNQALCETLQKRLCEELDHHVQKVVA